MSHKVKNMSKRLVFVMSVALASPGLAVPEISEQATRIAREALIADGHIDTPYRLESRWADVTQAADGGDFDYPRARAGGLDLPFMSIYTPAEMEAQGGAWQLANRLIDSMEALAARAPAVMDSNKVRGALCTAIPQSASLSVTRGGRR